jgi:hypothetical protein
MVVEYKDKGFQRMTFVSNGAYRHGESLKLTDSEEFLEGAVDGMLGQYGDAFLFLTGIIFTRHTN